ncbi:hypothetical protein HU200_054535 [Digitaria exilis]|uniref:Disease resistance protein At4g27190-like leucine-rich repeats domain-containing protein n=1 Tax=Digitaria exilis TaxID=1010633 RepID=A0A835E479_9POAL|nr:hypothetical protein HU200_054535 [Digitaria exilis]
MATLAGQFPTVHQAEATAPELVLLGEIDAGGIKGAVLSITRYLKDSNLPAIFLNGWQHGLGASAVLGSIARHPSPSLVEKFSKIIHIDCSKWKSRRALQRAITEELELPQWVNDAFDRRDKEDDFSGRDECSRTEIGDVTAVILRSLIQYKCLVIFHNGSDDVVDLVDFGIPPQVFGTKVLWTYGGRLRHVGPRLKNKVPESHVISYSNLSKGYSSSWKGLLAEEAREIALYTHKHGITPEVAQECCMYLLSLNHQGGNIIDYNWAAHASNYWVCDGIVAGGHDNQAWEIARALHQEIWLEDYSSNTLPDFGDELDAPHNRWIFVNPSNMEEKAHPGTTSLFLASSPSVFERPLAQLPFHQLHQLHVLKIYRCSFSFQLPPFHCCHNLRFLGIESCMDQQQAGEDDRDNKAVEVFQRLWVLDVCYTEWELSFTQEPGEETAIEIIEVHIKKGKIWHNSFAWRKLQNIRKLCIAEPTCSWETGDKDEFTDMVNLELLELSRNSSIQVLPSMSGATGLKTLILDGCARLEHVCPDVLPPSLESFSFDAGSDVTRISKISLAGCVNLHSFLLRGTLPGLEEVDLSGTSVRKVDLSFKVVQVNGLNKVILIGCKQLCALLWWQDRRHLKVLRIDTHGRNEQTQRNYDGYVIASDARIIQSLLHHRSYDLITDSLYLHLHNAPPSASTSERQSRSDNDIIPKPCCYNIKGIPSNDGGEIQWPPPSDRHVEVSEGINLADVEGDNGIDAIHNMMGQVHSLHVHNNSCMLSINLNKPWFDVIYLMGHTDHTTYRLRWCRVERCPKLQGVFIPDNINRLKFYQFPNLENIWASHLPMAGCIWSKGFLADSFTTHPIPQLQSIHIHNCPRLKFVLPLFFCMINFPSLETLHISHCGDLRQVFPWDDVIEPRTQAHGRQASTLVKGFPKLKHIHLHNLPSLEEICEGRMWAPMLKSIELRGCWALRRLPSVRPAAVVRIKRKFRGDDWHIPVVCPAAIVRIERDCWEKLQWDGLDAGHHPSMYEPRFSSPYYRKKGLLRGTVLR